MSVVEGALKKAGIATAGVLLAGVTGGAGYVALKAISGALEESAKQHSPFQSQQQDVGENLNTTG